jgi:hypothetical protein
VPSGLPVVQSGSDRLVGSGLGRKEAFMNSVDCRMVGRFIRPSAAKKGGARMKLQTKVKAGRIALNHNSTVQLKLKTRVKAGKIALNHNTTVQ